MAKHIHELIILITFLFSSPKLKWNQEETEVPFNILVQCTKNTQRNKHSRRKHQM